MWKVALLAFLSCATYIASGGRLPRDHDSGSGEVCFSNSHCSNGFVCKDLKCICPEGHVISENRCVRPEEESQSKCESDEQCKIPHGVCSNGKCVQEDASGNGLGDACNVTSECDLSAHLTCESGTCQCSPDHVEVDSNCLKKAGAIGEECTKSAQCEDVKAFCRDGTCQIISPGPERKICDDKNSDIVADQCECKEGFVKSDDELSCIEKAEKLGDGCVSSKQCEHLNGTCSDNTCLAMTMGEMSAPAAEAVPAKISSPCKHSDDCKSVNDAVCKEAICQCRLEYVSSEDQSKCLLLARKAGDQCEIEKQCSRVSDSSCVEGKCVAVAAAGIKTRSNGSPPSFETPARVVALTTFLVAALKIFP